MAESLTKEEGLILFLVSLLNFFCSVPLVFFFLRRHKMNERSGKTSTSLQGNPNYAVTELSLVLYITELCRNGIFVLDYSRLAFQYWDYCSSDDWSCTIFNVFKYICYNCSIMSYLVLCICICRYLYTYTFFLVSPRMTKSIMIWGGVAIGMVQFFISMGYNPTQFTIIGIVHSGDTSDIAVYVLSDILLWITCLMALTTIGYMIMQRNQNVFLKLAQFSVINALLTFLFPAFYIFLLDCQVVDANDSINSISSILILFSTGWNFLWLVHWNETFLQHQTKTYSPQLTSNYEENSYSSKTNEKQPFDNKGRYTVAKRDDVAVPLDLPKDTVKSVRDLNNKDNEKSARNLQKQENQELLKGLFAGMEEQGGIATTASIANNTAGKKKRKSKVKKSRPKNEDDDDEEEESSSSSLELGPQRPDIENMVFHTKESDNSDINRADLKYAGKLPPLVNLNESPRAKDNT